MKPMTRKCLANVVATTWPGQEHPSPTSRRHRLPLFGRRTVALAAAIALWPAFTAAGPAKSAWVFSEIPTLGGSSSIAWAINNNGQVVGQTTNSSGVDVGFSWTPGGGIVPVPMAGGGTFLSSVARDVNDRGDIVGWGNSFSGVDRGFLRTPGLAGSALLDDKTYLLSVNSRGSAVGYTNVDGPAVPLSLIGSRVRTFPGLSPGTDAFALGINSRDRAVVATSGRGSFLVYADTGGVITPSIETTLAINDVDEMAGRHTILFGANNGNAFVKFVDGTSRIAGAPNGGASTATSISNLGQIVGTYWDTPKVFQGNARAFLWESPINPRTGQVDLNTALPPNAAGWTLTAANDINDVFQIVGTATLNGQQRGYVLSLDQLVWEKAGSGSFREAAAWSGGLVPLARMAAVIDPLISSTITLSSATETRLRQLTVGGDATGNLGIATLAMNGGTLRLDAANGYGLEITAKGVLSGEGLIQSGVVNAGRIQSTNLWITGTLDNRGRMGGDGMVRAGFFANTGAGTVLVAAGQSFVLQADSGASNSGLLDVRSGGSSTVAGGTFANGSGGRIIADGGALRVDGTLVNAGQMQVTFGGASVFGLVNNAAGGKVILSGNSNTSFYDAVDLQSGSELRVSGGSTAVFFGTVYQRAGALATGSGTTFFEGGFSVGNSPALAQIEGNVVFGSANLYTGEIGGLAPGTGFDKLVVGGKLSFGGRLTIVSWAGFTAQIGQSFDLFDWGTTAGTFGTIDASGFMLAPGALLDTSRLYIDGSIGVTAVPEPATWLLWLAGLLGVTRMARRRLQ